MEKVDWIEFQYMSWLERLEFLDGLDADEFEFFNICDCWVWLPEKDTYDEWKFENNNWYYKNNKTFSWSESIKDVILDLVKVCDEHNIEVPIHIRLKYENTN